jgi:hypothetical protein
MSHVTHAAAAVAWASAHHFHRDGRKQGVLVDRIAGPNLQKFFASFFQKRRIFLLPQYH